MPQPSARRFNTTAGYLPPDPRDPDTFPVVVLAGFRIGAFVTDEGTVYIRVDSEFADSELRSPDGTIAVEFRIDSHPSGGAALPGERAGEPGSSSFAACSRPFPGAAAAREQQQHDRGRSVLPTALPPARGGHAAAARPALAAAAQVLRPLTPRSSMSPPTR